MIKIPPCDLPLVPMVRSTIGTIGTNGTIGSRKNVQGFLVTIGKNGTNSTIGRFTEATFGVLPTVKSANLPMVLLVPFLPMVTRKS